jgi:hypothetical protein
MQTLNLSTNALTACSGDFPNMTNLYENSRCWPENALETC